MKIKFLGTSHGVPAADRFCSSALVEAGGKLFVIDAGAPLIDLLLREGRRPEEVEAVFTTHAHGDHVDGLLQFCDLVSWYYKEASPEIFVTEDALTEAIYNLLCVLHSPPDLERMRFTLAKEGVVYDSPELKVTYLPTKHLLTRPAYSILLESEGKRVLFTGDMSNHLQRADFPAIVAEQHLDLVISEMAHFGVEHVSPYLETCKADRLIFNHVFPLRKLDEIEQLNGKYPFPVEIAHDGDVIEL